MNAAAVSAEPVLPAVTGADISKAEGYLGVSFDEPRREILRSNDSFDVQACPGSGKTTLLVAKLAVFAAKWPHTHRGICVLSHTNVARQEIEQKLGGTPVGRRLLTYPHFVGTIHGFVNEFLALPLLRSEGHHARVIDNDACFNWVRRRATSWPHRTRIGNLAYKDRTLEAAIWALIGAGEVTRPPTPASMTEDQWAVLLRVKGEAVRRGLWYYADMFAWAEKLLGKHPEVAGFARWRFPAVFLDEMQDTSELQGRVLSRIFPASECDLRQRFGDSNQAIYDSGQLAATTDPFPESGHRSLPNSQRFGASIATKVHSLAPAQPSPSLAGEGPRGGLLPGARDPAAIPHTIFAFSPRLTDQVLPAFGRLLLEVFPDEVIRNNSFLARAIGHVGKPGGTGANVPKHLGDYWAHYEPRATKLNPKPQLLADYVHLANRTRSAAGDCAESVRLLVKGVVELVALVHPESVPRGGQRTRWLWQSLAPDGTCLGLLRRLLWDWCIEPRSFSEHDWTNEVATLRQALMPINGTTWNRDADDFCRWSIEFSGGPPSREPQGATPPNRYRFQQGGRHVDIDVGTIHSAKGETHTATLVVETYFKTHDMKDLMPWICGQTFGAGSSDGKERRERMRLLYTAVTRPSHLLCLAMRRDSIGRGGEEVETRRRLEDLGWAIKEL